MGKVTHRTYNVVLTCISYTQFKHTITTLLQLNTFIYFFLLLLHLASAVSQLCFTALMSLSKLVLSRPSKIIEMPSSHRDFPTRFHMSELNLIAYFQSNSGPPMFLCETWCPLLMCLQTMQRASLGSFKKDVQDFMLVLCELLQENI